MKGGLAVDIHHPLSLFPIPITEQAQLSYDKCADETLNFSLEVQVFIYTPSSCTLDTTETLSTAICMYVNKSI